MATKWGICGTGAISVDFVSAVQLLPPTENCVVAVAAWNNLEKAKCFAEKLNIKDAFGSYKELAQHADIGNINVVVS